LKINCSRILPGEVKGKGVDRIVIKEEKRYREVFRTLALKRKKEKINY